MIVVKYAMDAPRGAKIVAPAEFGGQPLAPGVIANIRFGVPASRGVVHIEFTDGSQAEVLGMTELTLDLDTPERQARMAFAHAVLRRWNSED